MIACVILNDFLGLVERQHDRCPTDRPILILDGTRVMGACLEAASTGIRNGMPFRQAHMLCPEVVVVPFQPSHYREMNNAVIALLGRFTDCFEVGKAFWNARREGKRRAHHPSAGTYYLDFGDIQLSDALKLGQKLLDAIRDKWQTNVSIGISTGKFPAFIAARLAKQRRGFQFISPGQEAQTLAPLPVSVLPLEKEMLRRLQLLGIQTMGQFAGLPQGAVVDQFGFEGRRLYALAQGRDDNPVIPTPGRLSETVKQHLDGSVVDRYHIEGILRHLGCELGQQLEIKLLCAGSLELTLTLDNGQVISEEIILRRPTGDGDRIGRSLIRLLSQIQLTDGVVQIEVEAIGLQPLVMRQLDLFGFDVSVEQHRTFLNRRGVVSSIDLNTIAPGKNVAVGGLVVMHQAPPTAKGHHFITLEDEFGLTNVIVRTQIFARHRRVLRHNPLLIVQGKLQRADNVSSIIAKIASILQVS